jgi:DNA-binding transcriptional MerR regulator
MRIGELAEQVGVSADTLRFYERSGWLPRPVRRDNAYREYDENDVEHIRLLIDLRRLEIPLEDAARIAAWCHTGHCGDTTAALPGIIERQRAEIDTRIAGLRALDRRLGELQRHIARARPALNVLAGGAPCCDVAHAVLGIEGECSCCRGLPTRIAERES